MKRIIFSAVLTLLFCLMLEIQGTGGASQEPVEVKFHLFTSRDKIGVYDSLGARSIPRYIYDNKHMSFVIEGIEVETNLTLLSRNLTKEGIVFLVNWIKKDMPIDQTLICKRAEAAGKEVVTFIRGLERSGWVQRQKIHLIGYSVGGNVAAAAAETLGGNKVGRITGIHTPKCCEKPKRGCPNLDRTDAELVVVLGYSVYGIFVVHSQGHVEFYNSFACFCALTDVFVQVASMPSCTVKGKACKNLHELSCTQGEENTIGPTTKKPKKPTKYLVKSVPKECYPNGVEKKEKEKGFGGLFGG